MRVFVNLEMAEKVYSKKGEHMCPNDGWVCFRNSELISGRLGKVGLRGAKRSGKRGAGVRACAGPCGRAIGTTGTKTV